MRLDVYIVLMTLFASAGVGIAGAIAETINRRALRNKLWKGQLINSLWRKGSLTQVQDDISPTPTVR